MVVSMISMSVTRAVVDKQKKKLLVKCRTCDGTAKVTCGVCQGAQTLSYHPHAQAPVNAATPHTACAMCDASGLQVCLNCLGEGLAMPIEHILPQLQQPGQQQSA